jgi:hypothetical protein
MTEVCQVQIREQDAPVCEVSLAGPLELGRQRVGEPSPHQTLSGTPTSRAYLLPFSA